MQKHDMRQTRRTRKQLTDKKLVNRDCFGGRSEAAAICTFTAKGEEPCPWEGLRNLRPSAVFPDQQDLQRDVVGTTALPGDPHQFGASGCRPMAGHDTQEFLLAHLAP